MERSAGQWYLKIQRKKEMGIGHANPLAANLKDSLADYLNDFTAAASSSFTSNTV